MNWMIGQMMLQMMLKIIIQITKKNLIISSMIKYGMLINQMKKLIIAHQMLNRKVTIHHQMLKMNAWIAMMNYQMKSMIHTIAIPIANTSTKINLKMKNRI